MVRRGFQTNLKLFHELACLLNITATDTLIFVPFNHLLNKKFSADLIKLLLS